MTSHLIQLLGLDADVLLAGLALFPILAHPGFVALAGGSVASAEGERSDIGIWNIQLLVRIRGIDANQRIGKRGSGATVEDVSIDLLAVLQSDGNIATIIKSLFQRNAGLFFGR